MDFPVKVLAVFGTRPEAIKLVPPGAFEPNVREPANSILAGLPDVRLVEPLPHPESVGLMARGYLIFSDP